MQRRHDLRDWFELSASERRGSALLLLIIILLIAARLAVAISAEPDVFPSRLPDHVNEWIAESLADTMQGASGDAINKDLNLNNSELFIFNPNTLEESGWISLGLSAKQASVIRRYLESGGVFRKRSDLAKIYCIRSALYEKLYPFIDLPDSAASSKYAYEKPFSEGKNSKEFTYRRAPLELNGADSLTLVGLRGIGPFLAGKIIRYREALGGFYNTQQLLEVYRMTPGKLDTLSTSITLDAEKIRRLNINLATEEDLAKHPYLSRKQASGLASYRDKHGPFQSVEKITDCLLIDEKTFEKIRFYLTVQ